MDALKALWTVSAGVVPGIPLPEVVKTWTLTSGEFYEEDGSPNWGAFHEKNDAAYGYARAISDPMRLNWVTVDFTWI
jgi:hypothetical protein